MIAQIVIIALIGYAFQLMNDPTEDMIFSWYGRLLVKFSRINHACKHLSKPLGLCIICNTVWIGIIFGLTIFHETLIISLVIGIAASALANFIQVLHHYIINHLP